MGFFDLLNPVFGVLDNTILGWAPAWLIVSFYGLVSGILTMVVYAKVSNQEALNKGKIESKEALAAMKQLDPDADSEVVMATMKRAIKAPLIQAKNSIVPALVASIPLIFIMVWISQAYSYTTPDAGSQISAQLNPVVSVQQNEQVQVNDNDDLSLSWPATGEIEVAEQGGGVIAAVPASTRTPILHKRQWWNMLFANPAGYLDDGSPISAITLDLPKIELLGFGPAWMRTWWFIYFLVLMTAAIAIKVKFKIT